MTPNRFSKIAAGLLALSVAVTAQASSASIIRLVIAGDSIGAGNIVGADPWANLNIAGGYEVKNHSVSGSYLGQHASPNGYEPAELADFTAQYGAGHSWLIIQAGTNDLGQGAPGDVLYSDNTVKMIQDGHARGFRVLVATILPRNASNFAWGQSNEQQRLLYNSLVRANSAGADAIADLASDPVIGLTAKTFDSSLFADGLHPTGLAYTTYIEPVYSRALNNAAGAATPSTPAPVVTTPTPVQSAPTQTTAPANTNTASGGTVYQSSQNQLAAAAGQKSVSVEIHINAVPLTSPFFLTCLSLVNSGGQYVDQSGACFTPPQRSDVANGDERFNVDLALPSGLPAGSFTVVLSYMQYTGAGWQRAALGLGNGVTKSPETGNADPNQYSIATLTVTNPASAQPAPAQTQASAPATPPVTSAPAPTTIPAPSTTVASGLTALTSSTSSISAAANQSSVAVGVRYNAQPMSTPFYAPCLSLVSADGKYVDQSGACFTPPQRSDVASGPQSLTANLQLPAGLAPGAYMVVLSYMQWTGAGWQRAAMGLGGGVTQSPEVGIADPNQYAIATLNVGR